MSEERVWGDAPEQSPQEEQQEEPTAQSDDVESDVEDLAPEETESERPQPQYDSDLNWYEHHGWDERRGRTLGFGCEEVPLAIGTGKALMMKENGTRWAGTISTDSNAVLARITLFAENELWMRAAVEAMAKHLLV